MTLVNDHGRDSSTILWLFVILFLLLISITLIKLIQLCFTCHQLMSRTVYVPAYNAYRVCLFFMQIQPLPVIEV
uniref:Envelope protein n=1 Tax=Bat Coronavirus RfYN20 TaxID=3018890 RepID=A0AA49IDF1_9NIDO|nr:envelope protein [Bat Coronavirus RfYN20]